MVGPRGRRTGRHVGFGMQSRRSEIQGGAGAVPSAVLKRCFGRGSIFRPARKGGLSLASQERVEDRGPGHPLDAGRVVRHTVNQKAGAFEREKFEDHYETALGRFDGRAAQECRWRRGRSEELEKAGQKTKKPAAGQKETDADRRQEAGRRRSAAEDCLTDAGLETEAPRPSAYDAPPLS